MLHLLLHKDFFDLIDMDSFGSNSSFLRFAFNALKLGGLVYATSTDGYSSGNHRPHKFTDVTNCINLMFNEKIRKIKISIENLRINVKRIGSGDLVFALLL